MLISSMTWLWSWPVALCAYFRVCGRVRLKQGRHSCSPGSERRGRFAGDVGDYALLKFVSGRRALTLVFGRSMRHQVRWRRRRVARVARTRQTAGRRGPARGRVVVARRSIPVRTLCSSASNAATLLRVPSGGRLGFHAVERAVGVREKAVKDPHLRLDLRVDGVLAVHRQPPHRAALSRAAKRRQLPPVPCVMLFHAWPVVHFHRAARSAGSASPGCRTGHRVRQGTNRRCSRAAHRLGRCVHPTHVCGRP